MVTRWRCMRISIVLAAAVLASALLGGAAWAETIRLRNGDVLEGVEILESNDDRVVAEHPVLGRIVIPQDEIEPPASPAPSEAPTVIPGLFGTSFLAGWTRALSAGLTGASGKSQNLNINADLKLESRRERHRDRFVARYFLVSEDRSLSDNEFDATHDHDFLFLDSPL